MKPATKPAIVAINENLSTAGAVVWWRLSGDVNHAALSSAWYNEKLEIAMLPELPGEETALRRAVKDIEGPRRRVRPLKKRGHWTILDETVVADGDGKENLQIDPVLNVRYEESDTSSSVAFEVLSTDGQKLKSEIEVAYHEYQLKLTTQDVSAWMSKLVVSVSAVSLRDNGGVYFVPNTHIALWRSMVRAARTAASSNQFYEVPAMKSAEAINAILDAVEREAAGAALEMEQELERQGDDALGERALTTRKERLALLTTKIGTYETLLGTRLDSMRERIELLNGMITAAILAAAPDVPAFTV